MNPENIDITINYLEKRQLLSVRAANACRRIGLDKLNQVITHFLNYKSFKTQNCEAKTEAEIMTLSKNYLVNTDDLIEGYKSYETQELIKLNQKK